MYAIIEDSGMQYKVAEGDSVQLGLRDAEPGQSIEFDAVLMVSDDSGASIGRPTVEGARVTGEVEGVVKGRKIVVQRFRRRQGSHTRKQGHRQRYTSIHITRIVMPDRTPSEEPAPTAVAEAKAEQGGPDNGA